MEKVISKTALFNLTCSDLHFIRAVQLISLCMMCIAWPFRIPCVFTIYYLLRQLILSYGNNTKQMEDTATLTVRPFLNNVSCQ